MEKSHAFAATPLLPVTFCLMAGIIVGCWWNPGYIAICLTVAATAVAVGCRRWPVAQSVAILAGWAMVGMALTTVQRTADDADTSALYGRAMHGVVMSEPAERPKTICVDVLVPKDGGRTLRCYLRKDARSNALRPGDPIVFTLTGNTFVGGNRWQRGGTAISQMSHWQRTRLWFLQQRTRLLARYRGMGVGEDDYAVLAAMTLGDKSVMTRELRETYSVSGASHVLAISGMHVGIVYALLTLLTLGRRRFWMVQTVTVAAIWAYALLTGLSPSVCRAATMISVYAAFAKRGARTAPVNIMCFAAIVMLIADTRTIFDVSFQLSFAAVFAILLFLPLIKGMYQPKNKNANWIYTLAVMSLCAQIGTAPLVAYYFGRLPTYFFITNFIVIAAATLIIYCSFFSLLIPSVSGALTGMVRMMNTALAKIVTLPAASIGGLHPTVTQVALIYLLIVICFLVLKKVLSAKGDTETRGENY